MHQVPDTIVEGVENESLRLSPSSRWAVIVQYNDKADWMLLFKELSNDIHSGWLPTGWSTYTVILSNPNWGMNHRL